ncbi:MAG: 50S ribosomal protein L3 [Myxococcales bacterium]|nr:50S ribosomal protein L3 [Myxococcales bacterium]
MNTNLGLIGKKLGNTQIFTEDGSVLRVTAIQTGPCVVVGKRTQDKDGYSALRIGFGTRGAKHVRRPQSAEYEKLGVEAPAIVRELRLPAEQVATYTVGQTLAASDIFTEGHFVDVAGKSKGRGFTGVMRRHNFSGAGTVGHGTHEYKRHGGSIGQNMTPGRTFKGMGMPGQHGAKRVSVQNLRIAKILPEENIVLVEGGVPGAPQGLVLVRHAVKKPAKTEN